MYPETITPEYLQSVASLTDIEIESDRQNAISERDAYQKLAEGFHTLAWLPENQQSGKTRELNMKSSYYSDLVNQVNAQINFLERLIAARLRSVKGD